jgi:hypothetical protein
MHQIRTGPFFVAIVVAVVAVVATSVALPSQLNRSMFPRVNHPSIGYTLPSADPISKLNERIRQGDIELKSNGPLGYLESVLAALDIDLESQIVLFSKNSLQTPYIHPANPRLIYFNDTVVVAAIRHAPLIEVASVDPEKGVLFYTLEQQRPLGMPAFTKQDELCLRCHDSLNTVGVPGMITRSIMPSPDGRINPHLGNYVIDHESPFEQRWGGFYVTGRHGGLRHLGNGVITDPEDAESIRGNQELTLASIDGRVEDEAYLVPSSDIVALMVFEHQMHMINLLTRYGWEVRYARWNFQAPEPVSRVSNRIDLEEALGEVVDYMLFVNEAELPFPVTGSSDFSETFEAQGPRDNRGRSLRQLDLERRLRRYPLSYMIYSHAFYGLPVEARNAIYARLWQVLSGRDTDPRYDRLSPEDREAIIEILQSTKPDLPVYFDATR